MSTPFFILFFIDKPNKKCYNEVTPFFNVQFLNSLIFKD